MRQHHVFRPRLAEPLEARAVPSVAGVTATATLLGIPVSLPPQVQPGSARVQAIIDRFDQTYELAVETVLLAPGPGGSVDLAANRVAFDAAVVKALDALATDLVGTLGDVSPTSPEATGVVDAITGDGPDSLESRLLALPTRALEPLAATGSISIPLTHSTPIPLPALGAPVELATRPTTRIPIPQGVPSPAEVAGTAAGSTADVAQEIRRAFGTFLDDYFKAMKGVLLASQGGAVDPKAARSDFDDRVGQALRALGGSLGGTLDRYPAATGLAPQVRDAIAGDQAASLKSRLQGLPTPDGPHAAVVRDFTMGSVRIVADALSMITGNVSQALGPR